MQNSPLPLSTPSTSNLLKTIHYQIKTPSKNIVLLISDEKEISIRGKRGKKKSITTIIYTHLEKKKKIVFLFATPFNKQKALINITCEINEHVGS